MSYGRGDKKIRSTLLNDAAALSRAKQLGLLDQDKSRRPTARPWNEIALFNDSAYDLNRYDFLPIVAPQAQPSMDYSGTPYNWRNWTGITDESEHESLRNFRAVENTNNWVTQGSGNDGRLGWFAALLDKCESGDWQTAIVSGLVPRVVEMQVNEHRYAYVTTLGPTQVVKSTLSGPFRIRLRDQNTTGTAFPRNEHCILEINVPPPKGPWLVRNNTGAAANVGSTYSFSWCGSNNSGNLETVGAKVVGNSNIANGERALMYLETEDRANLGFYVYKS